MLRFNRKSPQGRKPPRNYLNRREQYRLMAMVFALGFVVLLAIRASDPATWTWLTGNTPQGVVVAKEHKQIESESPPTPANLDTRHRAVPIPPLPLDTVRVEADQNAQADEDTTLHPGVVGKHLREIRDNQPFRSVEAASWFNLLAVLDKADDTALKNAADGNVSFVQLFQQPEAYRGRVVNFQARIRRIKLVEAGKNSEGIKQYYELILKPQAGPPRPVFAYVLNLPEALRKKVGGELDEPIHLTGFFFKNWVYAGEHATFVAPVLLARGVHWNPPVPEPVYVPSFNTIAMVLVGSALVAALLAWIALRASRRTSPLPAQTNPGDVTASVALMAQFDTSRKDQLERPQAEPWQAQ